MGRPLVLPGASCHPINVKHLDANLDGFELGFNNRDNPRTFRDALRLPPAGENVEYSKLAG